MNSMQGEDFSEGILFFLILHGGGAEPPKIIGSGCTCGYLLFFQVNWLLVNGAGWCEIQLDPLIIGDHVSLLVNSSCTLPETNSNTDLTI